MEQPQVIQLLNSGEWIEGITIGGKAMENKIFPPLYETFSRDQKIGVLQVCFFMAHELTENGALYGKFPSFNFAYKVQDALLRDFMIQSMVPKNTTPMVRIGRTHTHMFISKVGLYMGDGKFATTEQLPELGAADFV